MYYVYIVKCNDGTYYTGYAVNIEKRIKTHNEKRGAKYTRGRLPVVLKYHEKYVNKSDALKREIEIKKMTREQKVILMKDYIIT